MLINNALLMVFFIHLQSLLCKWACVIYLLSKWPPWKITHMGLYFLPKIHKFYTRFALKLTILRKFWTLLIENGSILPKWPHFVKVAPKS